MTDSRDPDALISRAKPGDRHRDQHFLIDDRVLDRIPTYGPDSNGPILEIGAGTGGLTDRLLSIADQVTTVERDPELVTFLRTEFTEAIAENRLTVIEGDALEITLPEFDKCVSNLPYGVASEIAFRLLPLGKPLVLTFQLEFAQRMAAQPGDSDYGRLSVTAQHYADVEIVETIPPSAFDPQPAVESAVVVLRPREPDYDVPAERFMSFVRAVFTQRRKTLRNAIRNTTHISGIETPEDVLAATDASILGQRPGNLAPAELAAVTTIAIQTDAYS